MGYSSKKKIKRKKHIYVYRKTSRMQLNNKNNIRKASKIEGVGGFPIKKYEKSREYMYTL